MNLLRRFFLHNLGLKAISLVLAFLLWSQVGSQQVPVQFANLSADLEVTGDYATEVDIIIRSQRRVESVGQMSAEINLRDAEPGTAIFPLTNRNIINSPSGVEVLGVIPARLRLQLESIVEKTVRVETEIVGKPAEGFQLGSIRARPSEVTISGPESSISKITSTPTLPINVGGRDAGFSYEVALDPQDPRLRINLTTPVEVEIEIEEERREVSFSRIAVAFEPERRGVRILTRSVKLVGSVPISFEGKLAARDFQALIQVGSLEPRDEPYELVPVIFSPLNDQFRVESLQPEKVKVRVR